MQKVPYLDQPCERCGSKRRVLKTWKEKIPTFSGGTTEVEYSQIICTNEECQKALEKNLEKELKKREVLRAQKEENDKKRKQNSISAISKGKELRKNRSRI